MASVELALDENDKPIAPAKDLDISLYVQMEGKEMLLARFDRDTLSVNLELGFDDEDSIAFRVQGSATVHLVGHYEPYEEDDDANETGDTVVDEFKGLKIQLGNHGFGGEPNFGGQPNFG